MDNRDALYDMCRQYISDEADVLGSLKDILIGFIRSRNLEKLSTASELVDLHSTEVHTLRVLLQVEAFFKKNAIFSEERSGKAAAAASFLACEEHNRITNDRLDYYYEHQDDFERDHPGLPLLVERAQRYVANVLGPFERFLEEIPRRVKFTNGATASSARKDSQAYRKVSLKSFCSTGAVPYVTALRRYFGYVKGKVKVIDCNRVTTVPKNFKTRRTIACEQEGNVPFQLAWDGYIKDRLRLYGQDLRDQVRNQRLAKEASMTGRLATLDVKDASNTVAYNAVAWVFPYDWFRYADAFRAKAYLFDGVAFGRYNMFSSMGNGCTFTIETLLFAAFAHAVGSREFSIYGDDIIIETEHVPEYKRMLDFFGFTLNDKKSFITGPFRESCGGNYLRGSSVTPFYVRDFPKAKADWCHYVNGLASVSRPYGRVWKALRRIITDKELPFVPYSENTGSGVWLDIHTSYSKKLIKVRSGMPKVKCFIPKASGFRVYDSRTLFLWHHSKFSGETTSSRTSWKKYWKMSQEHESSWVPTMNHKYVFKWVCWYPPATASPGHIYIWSEYLTSQTPG